MIKTTRKSSMQLFLRWLTLGYTPVVSPAAETEDEIEILAETGSGPGTEQVLGNRWRKTARPQTIQAWDRNKTAEVFIFSAYGKAD